MQSRRYQCLIALIIVRQTAITLAFLLNKIGSELVRNNRKRLLWYSSIRYWKILDTNYIVPLNYYRNLLSCTYIIRILVKIQLNSSDAISFDIIILQFVFDMLPFTHKVHHARIDRKKKDVE